jgi:cytochrome b5
VTKYLDDHPGGAEVMMEFAGKDADNMFEDIGHSKEARNTMQKWIIGKLKGGIPKPAVKAEKERIAEIKSKGGLNPVVIFVVLVAIAVGLYFSQLSK